MGSPLCNGQGRSFLENALSKQEVYEVVQKREADEMRLKQFKLTKSERELEDAFLRGELVPVGKAEFDMIARAIAQRKKNAVLNIRINKYDLESLKQKAKKRGVKYQTFISEILHRVAHS